MPVATALAEDAAPEVRAAPARRAGALCDAFGPKRSAILVDEVHSLVEDADLVLSLQDLATSRHWRVRAAAVAVVPALAPCCAADRALRNLSNLANGLSFDAVDELQRLGTPPRQRDRKLALVLALDLAGVLGALPPEPADRARGRGGARHVRGAGRRSPPSASSALLATPHFASPGDRRLALDAATRLGDDGDPDVAREAKIASASFAAEEGPPPRPSRTSRSSRIARRLGCVKPRFNLHLRVHSSRVAALAPCGDPRAEVRNGALL
ncbi:hypothetical protein JL720_14621 [Aureococcus anophagefferens]|nr:hypothetical protein JL720_14621 [Aureococcus anophagefferens]